MFYYLSNGTPDDEREELRLLKPDKYFYLSQSGCTSLGKEDDSEKLDQLKVAMTVLGITSDIQENIFKILSAILLLGNVKFKSDGKEGSLVETPNG